MSSQISRRAGISTAGVLLSAAMMTLGSSAHADLINFNPTGGTSPMQSIGGIDLTDGNALTRGALTPTVGHSFQLYYQASVVGFVDKNSQTGATAGLDQSYQLTAVGSFTEVVTSVDAKGVATFSLASTQSKDSFFDLYYRASVSRDYKTGFGFNQGIRILASTPTAAATSQGTLPLASGGAGSFKLSMNVTALNTAFFATPIARIAIDSTLIVPNASLPDPAYNQVAGAGAPTLIYDPTRDVRYRADAGITFSGVAVPEPASLVQASLGLLLAAGAAGYRMRPRNTPAPAGVPA